MPAGGVVEHALAEFQSAPEFLWDSIAQVKMGSWSEGPVVLVGDAAWCLTLYSGSGATMGLLGGAVLGEKISEHDGDVGKALGAYESELCGKIWRYQFQVRFKSQMFVPSNWFFARLRMVLLRRLALRLPQA